MNLYNISNMCLSARFAVSVYIFSICHLIHIPLWRHCLFVAEGLCAPFEAESYAGGSLATGRSKLARQVKA
jgi:hypothetical protein